ncbi:LytR C-terminal domain-containing protein [Janthinobacterium lividum]|uniref:LytR C-terminal domain-containing protein n=1 Tax=Janthinobacterium lividum TaxID=29581 RepID=UPI000873DAE1|nr:LytR C-terminal domain-containing protein [Janthinobacterium lividum]MCC7715155.1 LytR C-terminal domain-containing protein [Janthinobacterium lividum]OEZ53317.1 tetratricopeptide repeat protein [Janthinobacterium lividum]WQE29307.1 LytR C-terminal domain-containing protein [Janthinobacterium lividum]STQ94782.1 Predicted O-linked N-acetylglucosamine transferase, SPINDLY family [Janthinobacterium lividum]
MRLTISRLAAACACLGLGACASHTAHAPRLPAPPAAAADAAYVAGRQYFDAGDLPAAQAAYEQALRAAPRHVNARNGLAVLHAQRGEHDAAIAHWLALTQEAGTPQPQQAYLFSNLGHAYYLSGRDAQALPALEQACLLDPLNALAWQHLAQVLERLGQHARAAVMRRQAASLQEHDLRRDMAVLRNAAPPQGVPVAAPVPDVPAMARIEITQTDGMARLQRVPAAVRSVPVAVAIPRPRLEIVNGNGVPGLAAALARSLAGAPVQVVRLANETSFQVARTRVEYRPAQEQAARQLARQLGMQVQTQVQTQAADCPVSELRLVLGRDLSDPSMLHRYYLQQLQLARQALARLG